jgi:hypothetical protein
VPVPTNGNDPLEWMTVDDKRLAELGADECLGELRDRFASAGGQQCAFYAGFRG